VADEVTTRAVRCDCGAIEAMVYREFEYTGDDGVPGKTARSWTSPEGWLPASREAPKSSLGVVIGWRCPTCAGNAR
jgi:hypothetical protein